MAPPDNSQKQLFLLLLVLFSSSSISSASDSVTPSKPLSGAQKLTSNGGLFQLGFFQPGKSPYYYIGIWYSLSRVSDLTPVWVANRETPLADHTTSEFRISENGNLILSNQTNPLIWSTNITAKSNNTIAVLLDSGNLVLRDASDPNSTLWQSIDHPTHTFLPGAKIGRNKITGETQRLTSWRSQDDPAPGIFTLEIDPNGTSQFFIQWNNSFNYWTSGTWNGRTFSLVPEMTANYIYDFGYVSNDKENYFIYSVKSQYSLISRLIMDVSGQIKQLTWVNNVEWILFWSQPRQQCQVYALCGPFGSCNENALPSCNCIKGFIPKSPSDWFLSDMSGGCVRKTQLQCNKNSSSQAEKDGFLTMSNMKLPDYPQIVRVQTDSDCLLACLNNCSCTAYSYDSSGCTHWYGELLDLQDQYGGSDEGTIFLRLAASDLPNSKSNKGVVIGAVIGGVVGFLALLAATWLLIWRSRRKGVMGKAKVVEGGLVAYPYGDLQRVTKNFSEKLGEGGFGSVFKGVLSPSTEIAVKQLEGIGQGKKQFRAEVITIGKIQHVNLVRLGGFCSEGIHKLLVYEYMPNGSLDTQLFRNGEVLDWKTRYQIALGTARGLAHLHEQCRDCIVHCDIKPENVLLDSSFVPKVVDFGLAKLIGYDFSRVVTTIGGNRGYLAPEWISGMAITAKADVYSYGMMLFEIISGKRNSDQSEGDKDGFFPTLAASKLMEGDAIGLVDGRLCGDANLEEVIKACKVACWCIQDDENSRPSMGQVVQILEGVLDVNMPPIPRALKILADNPGNIVSESSSNHSSKTQRTSSPSCQNKSSSSTSSKD